MCQNLDRPIKCEKIALALKKLDFQLITSFLQNYTLDFFLQGLNWELSTIAKPSFHKTVDLLLAIESWQSEKTGNFFDFWFMSLFELTFLGNYRFDFVHWFLSWKFHNYSGGFKWKLLYFHVCIKIILVLFFQNYWRSSTFELMFVRN